MIEAGLPAAEWKVTLPARKEIIVGNVKPFAVSSVAAESNRIAGRRVIVDFSKTLAEEITPETVSRWISIAPAPENLKAEVEDKTVTFKGKFALGVISRRVQGGSARAPAVQARSRADERSRLQGNCAAALLRRFRHAPTSGRHAPLPFALGERASHSRDSAALHRRHDTRGGESVRSLRRPLRRFAGGRSLQSRRRRKAAWKNNLGTRTQTPGVRRPNGNASVELGRDSRRTQDRRGVADRGIGRSRDGGTQTRRDTGRRSTHRSRRRLETRSRRRPVRSRLLAREGPGDSPA